ncbi:MAG: DUF3618 domain-containing protein [Chloroflexi bacterium]|nr:DUF3618 domain-containing protein [Chloroflexota bacterium]
MGQEADQLGGGGPAPTRVGDPNETAEEAADTAAARAHIEQTRADMSSTIDAIQDKLDPEVLSVQAKDTAHDVTDYAIREAKVAAREATDHAIEQAKAAVHEVSGQARTALREATIGKAEHMARTASETAGGWRSTLVETIKANPLPAAVAGLSIGWLFFNRSSGTAQVDYQSGASYGDYRPNEYRYPARSSYPASRGGAQVDEPAQAGVAQMADRAQQTAEHVAGQVQDTTGKAVGQLQDTSGQVVEQVQHQAVRAQGFLQQQLEENPLVVGAITIALGGLLAATMRPTSREDQLFGESRDRLVGSAQQLTQDTMQKAGQVVDRARNAAKQEAQEQNLLPQGPS